jgi:hypothetical protein
VKHFFASWKKKKNFRMQQKPGSSFWGVTTAWDRKGLSQEGKLGKQEAIVTLKDGTQFGRTY